MTAHTILVIEDDPAYRDNMELILRMEGCRVMTAADGVGALALLQENSPDLILCDIMMPGMDGRTLFERLKQERQTAEIPFIFVTALGGRENIRSGMSSGADDYLTKPFSPRELLLRIKKILSRGEPGEKPRDQMRFGDLLIDVPRHLASWKGRAFELTATEFKLLTTLAQRSGRVQSRDALLRDVWEYDSLIDTRTVDTHMRRLREKLGPASKHLDTVRGVGYRFVE